MNVLLSIKPKYANAILDRIKLVEFRKIVFKQEIDFVYIYSSAPEQKIVGFFTIEDIISDTPERLWNKFKRVGHIDEEDFFEYYGDKEIGYSIKIKSVNRFKKSIDPKEVFDNFVPPQSYMYCEKIH
jgi:predicted transcriptional regulator